MFLTENGLVSHSAFASLNYDCIFEQAAYTLGFEVEYSPDDAGSALPVLKIHGSCNFITEDIRHFRQHLTNPNSGLECGMDCLRPTGVESALRSKFFDPMAYHYPVMSLYATGKNTPVAPVKIQQIRNSWSKYASQASVVAVIGVRPSIDDTHIWNPVTTTAAKLFYIGSPNDFERWSCANSNFTFIAERFDQGFEGLLQVLVA